MLDFTGFVLVLILPILNSRRPDLCLGALNLHGMTANIFALHLPSGLKVVISVLKTDKAKTFGLRGPLVSDNSGFLNRWILGERFEQRLVRNLAG